MMNVHFAHRSFKLLGLGIALALAFGLADTTRACSTPVYRYAMYNWPSAPYRVFYFHRGESAEEDLAINKLVDELGDALPAPANVFVSTVDLSKTELDKLPVPVKEAFEACKDGEPTHLVFTPWGVDIFSGRLDKDTIAAMSESPARAKLAKLLEKGNATVLLLVPGKDKKENARAEKEIKKLIASAAGGEIPTSLAFQAPPPVGPDGEVDEDAAAAANRIDVAMLTVDRSDPAEKWLVKSLMTIEPDLNDLADEPMVFAVYGRARALEPYVGKGITSDNLAEIVMFVADACSCMVKDMNPGSDLLVKWDWDATAEKLAASDPSMNMSPYGYGEYPADGMQEEPAPAAQTEPEPEPEPEAMTDASTAVAAAATETAAAATETAAAAPVSEKSEEAAKPEAAADDDSTSEPAAMEPAAAESQPEAASEPEASEPVPEVAAGAESAESHAGHSAESHGESSPQASESAASRQLLTYGVGLLIGVVVVVGVGFVLLRKQSPS
jgi:hypothetical protein